MLSPEQCGVQVAGVEVTLDASLPALVDLTGFFSVRGRRRVVLHALAAPLCKGWRRRRETGESLESLNFGFFKTRATSFPHR